MGPAQKSFAAISVPYGRYESSVYLPSKFNLCSCARHLNWKNRRVDFAGAVVELRAKQPQRPVPNHVGGGQERSKVHILCEEDFHIPTVNSTWIAEEMHCSLQLSTLCQPEDLRSL